MPLKELGSRIQTARQAKGLSVEDVALKLKVHRYTLRAIEEGNLNDMPEPVYARGFTRTYAAYVGIDSEIVQEAVDQAFPLEKTPEYTDKMDRSAPDIKMHRRSTFKSFWLTLLVLIILAVAGAWYYMTYMSVPAAPAAAVQKEGITPVENAVPSGGLPMSDDQPFDPVPDPVSLDNTQPHAAVVSAPETHQATNPNTQTATQPAPQESSQPAGQTQRAQTAQTPQARPEPGPDAQPARENRPPLAPGEHSLVISASESAWFSIMVDGVQRSYTFEKDDSAEFRFRRQAILRLGNAGGVSIIYDGAVQPPAGERGTVRNMVFPPTAQ